MCKKILFFQKCLCLLGMLIINKYKLYYMVEPAHNQPCGSFARIPCYFSYYSELIEKGKENHFLCDSILINEQYPVGSHKKISL